MQDDPLLLDRGPAVRDAALGRMRALGVDYARVTVEWAQAARGARSTRARRARFRADDPSTYPVRNWDRLDGVVSSAQARGVGVYLNLTGPGPSFAHAAAPRSRRADRRTWKPRADAFGAFVKAVGIRYSGTYRDENAGGGTLPRVAFWGLYEEPNQGARLTPQSVRRGGRLVPWSPVMYRELWTAGREALDATGHGEDPLVAGETAAAGSVAPGSFLREVFCVRPDGRPYAGQAARDRRCSQLRRGGRLRAAAWAHHPGLGAVAPAQPAAVAGAITMANVAELGAALDQVARTGRVARRTAVILTGLGFESSPPDPFHGVALDRQAAFANEADLLAYRDPRVIGQTQSGLRDLPPAGRGVTPADWATPQSGLDFADGRPKPAADAYRLPFVATVEGGALALWGQLRFLPNGRSSSVSLEFRPAGEPAFRALGAALPVTNALGFFETRRPLHLRRRRLRPSPRRSGPRRPCRPRADRPPGLRPGIPPRRRRGHLPN